MKIPTITGRCHRRLLGACYLGFLLLALVTTTNPAAQSFSSGSDGSDGALTLPNFQGLIVFDPRDTARWGRALDPDGDGVYHFTTISIGFGTTLKLQGDKINKPVHWLATGDVAINGAIDLNGAHGVGTPDLSLRRLAAVPGSGGFPGGLGGRTLAPAVSPTPGEGPGGGSGGVPGSDCSILVGPPNVCGKNGVFTGNRYLIPLIGGSGGEGALWNDTNFYNGGAGGGAILIASSTSIALSGSGIISANGGTGGATVGGSGSGGAIRLAAPTITGSGSLSTSGGNGLTAGSPGSIRLEGFQISTSLRFPAGTQHVTRGAPVDSTNLVPPSGTVRVKAIAGMPIPLHPSGTFEMPDATINSANPVNVDIEATGIPPGTVVTLRIFVEIPDDPTIGYLPEVQAALAGTLELSTATVSITFPYGFSRGYVRATWTQ